MPKSLECKSIMSSRNLDKKSKLLCKQCGKCKELIQVFADFRVAIRIKYY